MPERKKKTTEMLPTVPMRGTVAFPHMVMHFDVARDMSIAAVEEALRRDRRVFLVAQKNVMDENPTREDLYQVGVIAEVKQTLQTQDETIRILVEGISRARIRKMEMHGDIIYTEPQRMHLSSRIPHDDIETDGMMRAVKDIYERYARLFPKMPKEIFIAVMCQEDPEKLFEEIVFNTMLDYKDKQILLEESGLFERLQLLCEILSRETMVLETEREIHDRTQESIDQGQREFFLREQLRIISSQLHEESGDASYDDPDSYAERIMELNLPEESEIKLLKEASRLTQMPPASQESYVVTSYLDTILDLPWNELTEDKIDLRDAQAALDADHYGLTKVKERILESLAVRVLNPELHGQILCLVGPPGIGKSSIGRSIAGAIGRKFARVSLGGVRDEADIRGHRKTYVGAMPGRIIAALQQAGTRNPVILLDELDKMGNDYKGDPSAAMLEVLDAEQNNAFRDHYIEIPFDLSQVMFVATANTLDAIPAPLRDRMEIIELTSYTREEKFQIAVRHLVSKQVVEHGLKLSQCRFDDDAIYEMIDAYTKEAGVRNLERTIGTVCRKVAKAIAAGERRRVQVHKKDLHSYLGVPKYLPDAKSRKSTVGLVNGLAWTSVGGVLMPLEAVVLEGTGKIEITGSLGSVMQESAKIAVTYARSVAREYGIPVDFYQKNDIHIHAPEGAVPKDGPSAGVTMATALVSALTGIPVRADVAMTGEITLHGAVMPIGGLREKSMAAYKAGIRTVIIPEENTPDLEEVEDIVKEHVTFVPVKQLSEVLEAALERPKRSAARSGSEGKKASASACR
ncbi:MAG: endopeptidase La [Oscillospiraceae bacterium]|nr:endopeptidase La [Oscillospiraceae bacterium]